MMKYQLILIAQLLSIYSVRGQLESDVDKIFVEFDGQPGCAVGIYQDGEIIFSKGYGLANLDFDIPIRPETVFDIGSVSKQFTAACIVLLAEEGKLSLEDPVRKYIPELPDYGEQPITIRHLLNHTSGLRDYLTLMRLRGDSFDDYYTENMGLSLLVRQRELNFKPGSEYLYSNSGYLALAVIVRRVSGLSIGQFTKKYIFDPLGMDRSFVYEDAGIVVRNRSTGYGLDGDRFVRNHHVDFVLGGDGQVYTTVEDFFHWNENFKTKKVGDFEKQLLVRGILNNGDTLDYALGMGIDKFAGRRVYGHMGSWGGFRAAYSRVPQDDLGIAVFCNYSRSQPGSKVEQILGLFYEDPAASDTKSQVQGQSTQMTASLRLSSKKLEAFTGWYWNDRDFYARKIYLRDDTLRYFRSETSENALVPMDKKEFKMADVGVDLRVLFDENETGVKRMTVTIDDGDPIVSTAFVPPDYAPEYLMNFTGSYYSEELDFEYQIKLEQDSLRIYFGEEMVNVKPARSNIFRGEHVTLIFSEGENGPRSGFRLMSGRVRNLKFAKKE